MQQNLSQEIRIMRVIIQGLTKNFEFKSIPTLF